MSERLNRRQFFSLNLEAATGFLGNFLAPQLELERDFFRPPGAVNELEFLTTCNRCGRCKDQCPEKIINLFSISASPKLVNTPYLKPNESPCTFCQKCIEVCPTEALSLSRSMKIGTAKIMKNTCLGYKNVMCDFCVYSCPEKGAIQLQNGKPVINEELCTGCGQCVSACISEVKGIQITL